MILGFAAVLKPSLSASLTAAFVLLGKPAEPPETAGVPFGGYGCGLSCTLPPPPGCVGAIGVDVPGCELAGAVVVGGGVTAGTGLSRDGEAADDWLLSNVPFEPL